MPSLIGLSPLPTAHPNRFQPYWFGPPSPFTETSPWPWVDHSVSGLLRATVRPIQTRFRFGSGPKPLTLPHIVTRRLIMQKARRQLSEDIALRLIVGMRFQVLFHSPSGVLFTFPSRYWFTIGHRVVFSLRRWASQIHTGFHVTRATWEHARRICVSFAYGAITLYGRLIQTVFS